MITHEASYEDAAGGTSLSFTLGPTVSDDLIVLEMSHRNTTNPSLGGTFSPSLTLKHTQAFNSGSWESYLWWARCTGDHDGETITASSVTSNTAFIANLYRGALASGDPLADATVVGEANAAGDNAQAQITTSTDGAMVALSVARGGQTISNQAATDPSSLTERIESDGNNMRLTHASAIKATAGATGSFSWSMSFDLLNGSWAYAITPAGSTAPASPLVNDSSLTKSRLLHTPLVRRIRSGLLVPDRRLVIPQIIPAGA